MTTPEREAEIIRLHFAEHWRVGTIAAQLGVHPDVVRRVLGLGDARPGGAPRPRLIDPYRGFIAETLARYPRLRTALADRERSLPEPSACLGLFAASDALGFGTCAERPSARTYRQVAPALLGRLGTIGPQLASGEQAVTGARDVGSFVRVIEAMRAHLEELVFVGTPIHATFSE